MIKYRLRFEHVILVLAAFITFASIWYSNSLVKKLAAEEEKRVTLFAEVQKFIFESADDNCETNFLFNNLVKVNESVPVIIADNEGNAIYDRNIGDSTLSPEAHTQLVEEELAEMKANEETRPPIKVEYAKGKFQYIYYRESDLLRNLRNFPYLQLLVIIIFISVVFAVFYVSKKSQQNRVWVGLAKETAHQLGTPVSSLMAWNELLKIKAGETREELLPTLNELERDIHRLEIITERFSKIGSKPELKPVNIKELLENAVAYLEKRISAKSKVRIILENKFPDTKTVSMSRPLFEWVIENLMKNALDALSNSQGMIILRAGETSRHIAIEVEDTGRGISSANIKKVFEPGFTTKKRGWGLGLSLSKRIIEEYHGGRIFIKKSELGKGTTFRIHLRKI
jgi:anti-sigma regulatory factor (Ser/Thr protein kinase)